MTWSQDELFSRCRDVRRTGDTEKALELMQDALRRGLLDPEGVIQAGRLIGKQLADDGPQDGVLTVGILGQCTTTWLGQAMSAIALGRGTRLLALDGQYDNVMQDIAALDDRADAVVLLPWNQRLLATDRPAEQRIADEVSFWQSVWEIAGRKNVRLIQIGYDWQSPGALGHNLSGRQDGDVAVVRQINERLREALPTGAYFVDLDQIAGLSGRRNFYSTRRYVWTKQPFSDAGVVELADAVFAGLRAVTSGPKKVLIVDLDNTLWGGVVGEQGPLGIEIGDTPAGEAFRRFQRHLKELSERGCLLAACSKNNREDALEPFEQNGDMVLRYDDFAAFEASWEPKAAAIQAIARQLSLGLDSFVFFDDEPAEREHIRQALPEVEVVDVPPEPADYVAALQKGGWFEAVGVTAEDLARTEQYRIERQRSDVRAAFESMDEYLASLEMTADVRPIDQPDIDRVVQLIGKTNQFNLTTRRHSRDDLREILQTPGSIGLTMRVRDRFGDYGLVGIVLALPDDTAGTCALRIDSWLMSCRVIGRTVEECLLNELISAGRERGCSKLIGEFLPTRKNGLVRDMYDRLGFTPTVEAEDGTRILELDLADAPFSKTFVKPAPHRE